MADTEGDGLIRVRRIGGDSYSYTATLVQIEVQVPSLLNWFGDTEPAHVYVTLGIDPDGVRLALAEGRLTNEEVLSWAKDTYPDMQAVLDAGWRLA